MKATGIIRRIDDLGRVVIPREIRRTLWLREGDPLELFIAEGGVLFKKYSPVGQFEDSDSLLKAMHKVTKAPVLLCDRDTVLYASKILESKYKEQLLSDGLITVIESRKLYTRGNGTDDIEVISGSGLKVEIALPIVSDGELFGAVVIPEGKEDLNWDTALVCAKMIAAYISAVLEF
jgi:AbrB family transcriptional regulator (stage V sporulation protein T)